MPGRSNGMVLDTKTPLLARLLLVAIVVSFAAVIARDALGVVPPVLANVWDKAYNAVEFLALLVCALRARGSTGTERGAWIALCTGILGFFAADLYYTFVLADMASPPFPSWADAGYLVIYPTGYVALVLLLRARAGRISSALWLDGLVCALAVAALGAALVLGVVASTDGSLATVATNLGYPLGDLALLAFVTAVITVTGRKAGMTWWLVAAGFGVFAVADTVYLYEVALGTYRENTLLDAGWPTAFMLLAFAAWQPARRLNARRLHGAGMLALPAVSGVTSIGILVVDHYSHQNDAAVWLASAALCVIVVRFGVTFRENLRMLDASEEEATTDALTGLANRRALGEDLAAAERPLVLALFDLDGFKSYNDTFGHPAGDALLERLGRNLAAALGDTGRAYRMGGDEFCVLAPAGPRDAELVMSAADALSERGGSFDIGCSYGLVRLDDGTDAVDALQRADRRLYENKRSRRAGTAESVHRVLMGVVGEHDGELHHHVVGVARLAERVGREMGLGAADLVHVRRAAALHDIGKIAIPDDILHAPRPLTDDEWQYMRQHTVIGERIISAAPELAPVAEIVRSSHERWDGGGYPDGLAAHDIPLGARIVAVCDSWEAMTSSRAYRAAMSPTLAMHELTRCSGTQFDPRIVAAFVAVRQAASEDDVAGTTTSCATSATIS